MRRAGDKAMPMAMAMAMAIKASEHRLPLPPARWGERAGVRGQRTARSERKAFGENQTLSRPSAPPPHPTSPPSEPGVEGPHFARASCVTAYRTTTPPEAPP